MRRYLRELEAEAIHIFREVAAEFERPVLLGRQGLLGPDPPRVEGIRAGQGPLPRALHPHDLQVP